MPLVPERALPVRCRTPWAAEAGIRAGEHLRVEALGPGRIVLTRAEDSLDDPIGALGRDVYPEGYLQELRGERE